MKRNVGPHYAAHGRPHVPTVPVPIPVLAAAALVAAFALGRFSGRMRRFGGSPCRTAARRFAGPPRKAAGCTPRREKEQPAEGEETVGA